jgi:hypothetical protein
VFDLEPAHHHELDTVNASQLGFWSVLSASVGTDGITSKCWNPGLAECLEFVALSKPRADLSWDPGGLDCSRDARFDVDFGPDVAFLWDPGSLESLQSIGFANFHLAYPHKLYVDKFESKFWDPGLADRPRFIELTRLSSDFQPAQLGWFPMVLWPQQNYGGTNRIALDVVWAKSEDFANALDIVLLVDGLHEIPVSWFTQPGDWKMVEKGPDRRVLTVFTTEAMQCLNSVLFIWVISSMGALMLNSSVLSAYQVPCIALYFVQMSARSEHKAV